MRTGNIPFLRLRIPELAVLNSCYMPFLKNGGLFIPTGCKYKLHSRVFLLLTLPGDSDKLALTATVAWITPQGALSGRTAGIGVQFSGAASKVRHRIEKLLGDRAVNAVPGQTHTL